MRHSGEKSSARALAPRGPCVQGALDPARGARLRWCVEGPKGLVGLHVLAGLLAMAGLLGLVGLALAACKGHESNRRDRSPREDGPVVESLPSLPRSCALEPRPQVYVLEVPGAPVLLSLVEARHLCLGEYVAVVRLEGRGPGLATQVVIDRQWWDVRRHRPPRQDQQIVSATFQRGTRRYLRIKWREGLSNPGERVLRLRLARVHRADGPPFDPGPWPALAPPPALERPHEGLSEKLRRVRSGVQETTRKIRKAHTILEGHPLARPPPEPMSDPREGPRRP